MQVTSVANGMVKGSREYVKRRRMEIKGMFVRYGGPVFFITVNPDDARHPLIVAMRSDTEGGYFENSVTESFARYNQKRLKMVAEDPVLQAQFFDTIFKAVIDVVFGFDKEPSKVGIFGEVSAYYAVVESQGKGTLHAHGLIWLMEGTSPFIYHRFEGG
jgi:hypothetical protein